MAAENKRLRALILTGLVVGMASLAGCMGSSDNKGEDGNAPPNAQLNVNRDRAWNTETLIFHAEGSDDPDGNITMYRYDFGDGTVVEVRETEETDEDDTSNEEARVTHRYLAGGEYTVTLTVTDDGGEQSGSLTDTDSKMVKINEETAVPALVIYSAPAGESELAKYQQNFDVRKGADVFEVDLDVNGTTVVGTSTIKAYVVDGSGATLDEETIMVDAGQMGDIFLEGDLSDEGRHTLVIQAESGGAQVNGELRVFYDA